MQNQVEGFCQQKLPVAEFLYVSDHLASCEACRRQIEKALGENAAFFLLQSKMLHELAGHLPSTAGSSHLTFEQMAAYINGSLTSEEQRVAKDHLAACEPCALAVTDLYEFRHEVAPELDRAYHPATAPAAESWRRRIGTFLTAAFPRSPALAFGSALAALLLIVTGLLLWQTRRKQEAPREIVTTTPTPFVAPTGASAEIPTGSPTSPLENVIAQLNDGAGRVTLDQAGRLSGLENLPPAYQQMVKSALTHQRLEKSSLLTGLN